MRNKRIFTDFSSTTYTYTCCTCKYRNQVQSRRGSVDHIVEFSSLFAAAGWSVEVCRRCSVLAPPLHDPNTFAEAETATRPRSKREKTLKCKAPLYMYFNRRVCLYFVCTYRKCKCTERSTDDVSACVVTGDRNVFTAASVAYQMPEQTKNQ